MSLDAKPDTDDGQPLIFWDSIFVYGCLIFFTLIFASACVYLGYKVGALFDVT
jgi:hypothetical protein